MNIRLNTHELSFQKTIKDFIAERLPDDIRHRVLNGEELPAEDVARWQKILHAQGWGAPGWPKEFGGTGWNELERYIFERECALSGAPPQATFGLKMVAPVLMRFGTVEQQQRFLPAILTGDDCWCQGYSEPGAGSDLASLKTRAQRDGDDYVVNGQKTWTTQAQDADWMFCLVRTNSTGKPQAGISFLLIDMKSPCVTVRPITLLDNTQEVNEVWFDNVRVPAKNLVGEENSGWTYAKYLLGHERTLIADIGTSLRELAWLKRIAASRMRGGRPLLEDTLFASRVAQVEIELRALEISNLRVIAANEEQRAPGPDASLLKIRGSEIRQTISELMVQAAGQEALRWPGLGDVATVDTYPLTRAYLNLRKLSIYGGSNEIQKNIIAKMMLGL